MMTLDLILFELARLFQWPVALGVVLSFVYAVYAVSYTHLVHGYLPIR